VAAAGADDGFDFEETAEDLAAGAYRHVVFRRQAALMLLAAASAGLAVADYAFGVAALRLMPAWLAEAASAFMAVEFYTWLSGYARTRRERIAASAGLLEGERALASLDRLKAATRPLPLPWWRCGPRSRRFWHGLLIRGAYSACAALVLVSYLGPLAGGISATACLTAVLAVRVKSGGAITATVNALSFADPRPPRDSPET
jgi:hypothetical protein